MPVSIYFSPTKLNAKQYDNCLKNLEKAGVGTPEGRLYHTCFGSGDQLKVYEIWDTQENLNKFKTVMEPIVKAEGIDIGQPSVQTVYNIIQGEEGTRARRAA